MSIFSTRVVRRRRATLALVLCGAAFAATRWSVASFVSGYAGSISRAAPNSFSTGRRAEILEGMVEVEEVEEEGDLTMALTTEEYALALEQEMLAERKRYFINGEIKKNNLVVPWRDVDEDAVEKEARKRLQNNGIFDPSGPTRVDETDGKVKVTLVGSQDISLQWTAGSPGQKVGYMVERKRAEDTKFVELATYEGFADTNLLSKPYAGENHRYTDELVKPASYVYRVLVRLRSGEVQVVDQVEIEVPEESGLDIKVAGGVLSLFFFGMVLATSLSDFV